MFVAGWGKDRTFLGGVPSMKCEHCNNTGPWDVWLAEKHADVYLMKVARWDRRVICVCSVCEHGFEIQPSKLKGFFAEIWPFVERLFMAQDRSVQKGMIGGLERVGLKDEATKLKPLLKPLFSRL